MVCIAMDYTNVGITKFRAYKKLGFTSVLRFVYYERIIVYKPYGLKPVIHKTTNYGN